MERTKTNTPSIEIKVLIKPSLIITSDWHLREENPTCWVGDFQMEQWIAVAFVSQLQKKYGCPVVHGGDLFHHWKPSPWLLSQTIDLLPKEFYTIYGQHDLPQHNWELRGKSGIKTLEIAGRLKVLSGCHYGETPSDVCNVRDELKGVGKNILVWHHLTYTKAPFPGATGGMAEGILRKYPQFDLIITGDNHQSFTIEYQGRRLINPGNLTRQVADQVDFKPRVALWYAQTNTIEWVYLPIKEDVISRAHIDKVEERNGRIDAFMSKLDGIWEAEMSFEENLDKFFKQNTIKESTKQIIYKAIE